jgi:hypothetical protein
MMNYIKLINRLAILILPLIVVLMYGACFNIASQPAQPQTTENQTQPVAQYTLNSLEVTPMPVIAGQDFTLKLNVTNINNVRGDYTGSLIVDGKQGESRKVSINPGGSAYIVFQTMVNEAGLHHLQIGSQTLDITVIKNSVPITIKIDNGHVDGCDPVAGSTGDPAQVVIEPEGHMIKLTAPEGGLTITGVQVNGNIKSSSYDFDHDNILGGPGYWVYGPDVLMVDSSKPYFTLNIYEDARKKVFSSDYSKTLFTYTPTTVTLPIPDIKVQGDFYIEIVTYNMPRLNATGLWDKDRIGRYVVHTWYYQLCIGYESAIDVQSSVSIDGSVVPGRYLSYNWIIRADGYQE